MPVKVMAAVKLENEYVIDLCIRPDFTVQAEEQEEEQGQKVSTINLVH